MGDGNHSLDEALDRLADLGVSALARDVFEPVNAAMIARAKSEMQTRSGAMSFFSDYWSVARAAAAVFDEPKFARQAAAMFFSGAPERCSAWAAIELVDGKPRLGISDLRDLATAASSARDRNSGAFNAVLMDAMIARPDDEAREALAAAESREAPKSPKAWAALRNGGNGRYAGRIADDGLRGKADPSACQAGAPCSLCHAVRSHAGRGCGWRRTTAVRHAATYPCQAGRTLWLGARASDAASAIGVKLLNSRLSRSRRYT